MPQNTPYPGETPQQFQMRMMQGGGPPPGAQQSPVVSPGMAPPAAAPQAGEQNPYGLDPAVLEAMLGTYGDQMELGAMDAQMAQAEALRQATPEGRSTGRVYVAANPLEHIGKGIGDYKLMKKRQQYEKDSAATRGRIGENVKLYGKNRPQE
jgi:hypothetical protein